MVTAYPVAGKAKSLEICRSFVEGCGGAVLTAPPPALVEGPAFFYGVDKSNRHLFDQVKQEGRDYYYCDNSYFDDARQAYFRVTKNALQHTGRGTSSGSRLEKLGVKLGFYKRGKHLVVCPQSDSFMKDIVGYASKHGSWLQDAQYEISQRTQRALRVRLWSPDKGRLAATLADDLNGAHALVTWSSAAAVTAVLAGVPVFCAPSCAAAAVGNTDWNSLETPYFPDETTRLNWARVLADNQWTLDEMRNGTAWGSLNG